MKTLALKIGYFFVLVFFLPAAAFAWDYSLRFNSSHHRFSGYHRPYRYDRPYSSSYLHSHSRFSDYYSYSGSYNSSRFYEYASYRSGINHYFQKHYYYPLSFSFSVPGRIKVYVDNGSGPRQIFQRDGFTNQAWQALKKGDYEIALDYFAMEADMKKKSGVSLSGYALTAASLGNLDLAAKIMRRAFKTNPEAFSIDPDSLRHLHLDKQSNILITNLLEKYAADDNSSRANKAFMLSVLNYLKHDYSAAKRFVSIAQQSGDESQSSNNLQKLIDQQLKTRKNDLASLIQIH